MSSRIGDAEDAWMWLQGAVADAEEGDLESCVSSYDLARPRIEAAAGKLSELGLWAEVDAAVRDSLELTKKGNYSEAQALLTKVGRRMREASGSNDALRKRYGLKR